MAHSRTLLGACCVLSALVGCVGVGKPASDTMMNENRDLRDVIRAQEQRIDELTRQRNVLERKVESGAGASDTAPETTGPDLPQPDMGASTQRVLERFRSDSDVEVESMREGYRFVLREKVLFGSASAELTADGRAALQRVADSLRGQGTRIVIEGHTDNVKLVKGTVLQQYPRGNIELSVARALAVWEYLIRDGHIDEPRVSVVGFGPHSPRVPNDSERNRYRNRRVEIRVAEAR